MRSFNGGFLPWRCSGRQRRIGERRRHPLGNKPWKKELHHQDKLWIRSLERMLQWRKIKRERKREGGHHEPSPESLLNLEMEDFDFDKMDLDGQSREISDDDIEDW